MRARRAPLPYTALFLLLLLACACGPERPGPLAPGKPAGLPRPTREVRALTLPFDAFALSLGDYYTVANALDVLTRRCMREKGLDWTVLKRPADAVEFRHRRRYGVLEEAVAARFGYHAPERLVNPYDVAAREELREAGLGPRERDAALAPDGCLPRAQRRLDRGEASADDRLNALDAQAFEASGRVATTRRATAAWRACMRRGGFAYASPDAAVNDTRWWSDDRRTASRKEIAVARADVRCKHRSGLVPAWHAAEVRLQRKAFREHPALFAALERARSRRLAAARAVLAGR